MRLQDALSTRPNDRHNFDHRCFPCGIDYLEMLAMDTYKRRELNFFRFCRGENRLPIRWNRLPHSFCRLSCVRGVYGEFPIPHPHAQGKCQVVLFKSRRASSSFKSIENFCCWGQLLTTKFFFTGYRTLRNELNVLPSYSSITWVGKV